MAFKINTDTNTSSQINTSILDQVYPQGNLSVPIYSVEPPVSREGTLYFNSNDQSLKFSTDVWNTLGGPTVLPPALQSIADLKTNGNEMIYTVATNTYATTPTSGVSSLQQVYQLNEQFWDWS